MHLFAPILELSLVSKERIQNAGKLVSICIETDQTNPTLVNLDVVPEKRKNVSNHP